MKITSPGSNPGILFAGEEKASASTEASTVLFSHVLARVAATTGVAVFSVAMLFKAIAISEEIVLATTPDKNLTEFFAPIARRVGASRFSPEDLAHRAQMSAMDVARLSIDLPQRADRVLADVERGNLRVWARIEDLEPMLRRLERMVERANAAMIAAACIIGVTILLAVYHPQGWRAAIAWTFWIAIAIAASIVFRTALATLRNRK